jgi:hypothetical protein
MVTTAPDIVATGAAVTPGRDETLTVLELPPLATTTPDGLRETVSPLTVATEPPAEIV